jgi:hypothetical protein
MTEQIIINIEFDQQPSGTIDKIPHESLYQFPPFEYEHKDKAVQVPGHTYPMLKTYRAFDMTDTYGQQHQVVISIGKEFGSIYSCDLRPLSPVDGISYVDMGFNNKAAVMVQDPEVYSAYPLARTMLQWGFITPADLGKVATFNIISRLPELKTVDGTPTLNIDKNTGLVRYSQQRHPLINAHKFLQWGIAHLDGMPRNVNISYGIHAGPVTAVTLNWEAGGTNFKSFTKTYKNTASVEEALAATFSIRRMQEMGFNVRGVLIDYADPKSLQQGQERLLKEPSMVQVFVTRSGDRKRYPVISNRGGKNIYNFDLRVVEM